MSMYRFENAKLLKSTMSTMSKLPGILVRTSGFRISLSAREQAQEAKTAVRETVAVLWWSRVRAAGGSWQESSAGGSAVGTGIVLVSTRGSPSSVHGSGMLLRTESWRRNHS